ncbi:MAG: V-type ATP synthase subunit D [Chloroflexi bacterium]|jgi:V/A-type H+/Na+-transporting ATPase subunit D|nr:V-type ATP synthase subunit D [Chloroflexota bacterium]
MAIELKRQRDEMERFERYLPMLRMKQFQIRLSIWKAKTELSQARKATLAMTEKFNRYEAVMNDVSGINVGELATCKKTRTSMKNIAGLQIPVFEEAVFPEAQYSLFATPPWVNTAISDLRRLNECLAIESVLEQQHKLLQKEPTKVTQRVNLFKQVKIPEIKENIRRIRIQLGERMTAAVIRAKITKNKSMYLGQ